MYILYIETGFILEYKKNFKFSYVDDFSDLSVFKHL